MRIVGNRTGFYKVSMLTENIIHIRYSIYRKGTSIAVLQHYSVFARSTGPGLGTDNFSQVSGTIQIFKSDTKMEQKFDRVTGTNNDSRFSIFIHVLWA